MTETGLLIAQGAILLLLFGFLVAVVRAAGRHVSRATPPPMPMDDPVQRPEPGPAAAAAPSALDGWPPDDEPLPPLFTDPAPPTPPVVADPFPPLVAADPFPPLAGGDTSTAPVVAGEMPDLGAGGDADADGPAPEDTNPFGDTGAARVLKHEEDRTFLNLDSGNLQPRLVVERGPGLEEGAVYSLGQGLTIGRSRSNELHVDDSYVSHMHARILRRGAFFYVEDLGSTNGTFLNDARVEGGTPLRVRDVLRMGETILRYEE